jgi:hypothetical protein
MPPRHFNRLRKLGLALPDAHEQVAWSEPTFRVRNKLFAMYASAETHHGGGRPAVWINAAPENQAMLVRSHPDRFFIPPYVGPKGWIGVWLDGSPDWTELNELLTDGWRRTAPKTLHAKLAR